MRAKLIIISFLMHCVLFSQWTEILVDNTGARFGEVCVVNPNLIWAVKVDNIMNICKTTNQGASWQTFQLNERIYYASAIDENIAWVSTLYGNVYKTTNGGNNWVQQFYSPKSFINFLKFFNANTGFFVADPVNDTVGFFYTRNGGINWSRSVNAPIINYNLALLENCVNALDTNFLWMCAQTSSGVYKFYSLKGGLNSIWQSFAYGETGAYRSAVFKDSLNGLAAGTKILITFDGGRTWRIRNQVSLDGGWPANFMYVPGTDWIILNSPNRVKISRDFGENWHSVSYYGTFDLYYGDCKDTNSIWLAYNYGKLLKYNSVIGIIKTSQQIPDKYKLGQNYPNPFNPITHFEFDISNPGFVSLKIFNVLGREIETIVKENLEPGTYSVSWEATDYPSGVYFYRLAAGDFSMVRKMIVVK